MAEFVDSGGVTRYEGEIVYPGATPGDVLTVGAGGAISPAPGGGSQPAIEMVSVPISSAELLALDVTPKELLAAAGGRVYHVVHGIVLHYRFETMAYTGDFLPTFGYGSTVAEINAGNNGIGSAFNFQARAVVGSPLAGAPESLLQQTADAYLSLVNASAYMPNQWDAWMADKIEDKPVSIGNVPNNANADLGAITAVDQMAQTFTIAGNVSALLPAGRRIVVTGSTGNDGSYTVVSAVFGVATVITVVEAVPDPTVDGELFSTALDDGDGTVTVRLFYTTIDGAP